MMSFKEAWNIRRRDWCRDMTEPFYQKLSNIFLWIFMNLKLSANTVSQLMAISSIIAGILFLTGDKLYLIIGSILFIIAMSMDFADGDIARITNTFSKIGIFYDNIHHTCEEIFTFIGLGIFLAKTYSNPYSIYMGIIISFLIYILSDFKAITYWFCKRDISYDQKYRKFPYVLLYGEFFKWWHPLILFALILNQIPSIFFIAFIWAILRFIPHMYIYYKECKIYDRENSI